jgi:hypothetical protein
MKQAESRGRYLYGKAVTGLILAVMLAVLGACAGVFDEEPEEATIGHSQGETVKVKVNTGEAAGRSMAVDGVQRFVNFYEVIFKTKETTPVYYRGVDTDGTIIVSVPIANDYEVLLLAGYDYTLLAAGYVYDVDIKPDEANIVSITMTRFPLQWDTKAEKDSTSGSYINDNNDFEFSAAIMGYTSTSALKIESRYINVAPVVTGASPLGPENIIATDSLTVKVDLKRLWPLFIADLQTTDPNDKKEKAGGTPANKKLTLEGAEVKLWSRYGRDQFGSIPFDVTGGGALPTPTLEATKAILSFTGKGLPNWDVDGVLQVDVRYRAFGAAKEVQSGSNTVPGPGAPFRLWVIRNGLQTYVADATANPLATVKDSTVPEQGTGTGSEFVVKFGSGSPNKVEVIAD